MKKISALCLTVLCCSLLSTAVTASNLKAYKNIGLVSGNPGYQVTCKSTTRSIKIYKTNAGWHQLSKGLLKFSSRDMSVEEVAEKICNSL